MNIFAISGSARPKGSNYLLLEAIQALAEKEHTFELFDDIQTFPLFTPEKLKRGVPEVVKEFKEKVIAADAIIISTPEYAHNIPAVVKNMIEWCTASGEFYHKNILPITFTPHEPRGEYAMQSLRFSLMTLKATIVAELSMYKTEVKIENQQLHLPNELKEMVMSAIELL